MLRQGAFAVCKQHVSPTDLDIRKVSLECVGAGVACVEKHEFGLFQMTGRQSLLALKRDWLRLINMAATHLNNFPFFNEKDIPPTVR